MTSGPVRPSQSHPNSYSSTATACPSAGSSCRQTWSHFKEKPSGHTPSRSREANPRPATPLLERRAAANGRAGDGWGGQRFEPSWGNLSHPPRPRSPSLQSLGLGPRRLAPHPGQVFIAGPGAPLPRPGPREPRIMAENPRNRPQLWPKQYPEGTRASRCPPSLGTVGAGLPGAGWATGVDTRTARGTESAETDVSAHRAGQVAQCPPRRKGRCGRAEPHSVSIPSLLRPGYYAPCSHGHGSCPSLPVQSAACAALSPRLSAVVSPPAPPLTPVPQSGPA